MELRSRMTWSGLVTIEIMGPRPRRITISNLITDAALNLYRDVLRNVRGGFTIEYVALGSGTTPPSPSDTQLEAEFFRKPVTDREPVGTGALDTIVYIAPQEANQQIEEIGWFGAGATSAPNSGVLIARVLWSHLKTYLESIQITRRDTFARG